MTVKELIKHLEGFDGDKIILIEGVNNVLRFPEEVISWQSDHVLIALKGV